MAYNKAFLFAVLAIIVVAVQAFPGPPKAEKSDLKAESSYGFGYAYGTPWSYASHHQYGYGYPYGYAYNYPYSYYGHDGGLYGSYSYWG